MNTIIDFIKWCFRNNDAGICSIIVLGIIVSGVTATISAIFSGIAKIIKAKNKIS
jgi:hypothetical protein